jgi:uncharacterized protein YtpQ (UPF0354 family)
MAGFISAKSKKFIPTDIFIKEMKKRKRQKERYEMKKQRGAVVGARKPPAEKKIKVPGKRGRPCKYPRPVSVEKKVHVAKTSSLGAVGKRRREVQKEFQEKEKLQRKRCREALMSQKKKIKHDLQEDIKDQRTFFFKLNKLGSLADKCREVFDKLHCEFTKDPIKDQEFLEIYQNCCAQKQTMFALLDECVSIWETKREKIEEKQKHLVSLEMIVNSDGEEFFEMNDS